MTEVKVTRVTGKVETHRALSILLACPVCRPMAEQLLDDADAGLPPRVAVVPCPACAEKYASGPAH